MNVLEGLNLGETVYLDDRRYRAYHDHMMDLTYFKLSELGVALLKACSFELKDREFQRTIDSAKGESI
jgi:hypothetical protein